jgi:hypothetical protein
MVLTVDATTDASSGSDAGTETVAATKGSSAGYVHAAVSSATAAATEGGAAADRRANCICDPLDNDGTPNAQPPFCRCGIARFAQCAMSKSVRASSVRAKSAGTGWLISRQSKKLPQGEGCVLWTRFGRAVPVLLLPSGALLPVKRRPSDTRVGCNHCSPRHSKKNMNCFAVTGIAAPALPPGSLVKAATGDVIKGVWATR